MKEATAPSAIGRPVQVPEVYAAPWRLARQSAHETYAVLSKFGRRRRQNSLQ